MSADLIARLIEAGTPAALVADVAMALGRAASDQAALSDRREKDRLRQQEKRGRDKASRDVTVRHATSADTADEAPTPALSPNEILNPNPTPTRENTPARKGLDPKSVFDAWNAMAKRTGLPVASRLTEGRRKRIDARLAEYGSDAMTEAIAAVERSAFCRGDSGGGWRADFDFLLQASSFTKLIEGSYDRSPSRSSGQSNGRSSSHPGGRIGAASDRVFGSLADERG